VDSFYFTHWALLAPKSRSVKSFEFDIESQRSSSAASELFISPVNSGERPPTLQPLADAFRKLANLCSSSEKTEFDLTRGAIEAKKRGRAIVFKYREMFHNLNSSSQELLLAQLKDISRIISDADVGPFRNKIVHGNNSPISQDEIDLAIRKLKDLVAIIRENGFFPIAWIFDSQSINSSGFSITKYVSSGLSVEVEEPTPSYSEGLPQLGRSPIFMRTARLEHLGPLRFVFAPSRPNAIFWEGFPPEIIRREVSESETSYLAHEVSGVA
jgi:hypothetical protein